jgi:hypothetical protein
VRIWDVSAARTHYVGARGKASLECDLEVGVPLRKGSVTRGKGLCAVHNIPCFFDISLAMTKGHNRDYTLKIFQNYMFSYVT